MWDLPPPSGPLLCVETLRSLSILHTTMSTALKTAALAGLVASASAFAPGLVQQPARAANRGAVCGLSMQGIKPTGTLIRQTFLTPTLFNNIDVDGSGTIDLEELKEAVKFTDSASVRDLIQRADLNGDGNDLCKKRLNVLMRVHC